MTKWDKKKFIKKTKSDCMSHVSMITMDLIKFAEDNADQIVWGSGDQFGTMTFKCKSHDPPMQFPDLLMTVGPEERERIQSTIAHWDCLVMTKILRESKKVQTASPFGAYSTDR